MAMVQWRGNQPIRVDWFGVRYLMAIRNSRTTHPLDALPMIDTLNHEMDTRWQHRIQLISHPLADAVLSERAVWLQLASTSPFPVDSIIAYGDPGTRLGKYVAFASSNKPRVVLATHSYCGEKSLALVVPDVRASDFRRDGRDIVVDVQETRLISVPQFPDTPGWFLPHPTALVPHGMAVHAGPDARFLWRLSFSFVGFLARGIPGGYGQFQGVDAGYHSSSSLGLVVAVPEPQLEHLQLFLQPRASPDPATLTFPCSVQDLAHVRFQAAAAVAALRSEADPQLLDPISRLLAILKNAQP